MMDHMQRRRGGSFRADEDEQESGDNVQFVTPYYEGHEAPEPLDLSKLRLDNMGPEDGGSSDEEEDEEEMYTRGRSRSRSVHANDADGSSYMVQEEGSSDPPLPNLDQSGEDGMKGNSKTERTGPLAPREVVALQKVHLIVFTCNLHTHCMYITHS
ncbi:hypothetical protein EON64_17490 [archaeon]|nr:MAG: hypothetical protein EON64_17490 [archaeon]